MKILRRYLALELERRADREARQAQQAQVAEARKATRYARHGLLLAIVATVVTIGSVALQTVFAGDGADRYFAVEEGWTPSYFVAAPATDLPSPGSFAQGCNADLPAGLEATLGQDKVFPADQYVAITAYGATEAARVTVLEATLTVYDHWTPPAPMTEVTCTPAGDGLPAVLAAADLNAPDEGIRLDADGQTIVLGRSGTYEATADDGGGLIIIDLEGTPGDAYRFSVTATAVVTGERVTTSAGSADEPLVTYVPQGGEQSVSYE